MSKRKETVEKNLMRFRGTAYEPFMPLRQCADPRQLAGFAENQDRVAGLFARYKLGLAVDNDGRVYDKQIWIVPGRKGQAWEHGAGKLGITVVGSRFIGNVIGKLKDIIEVNQLGDDEANLFASWTPDNEARVMDAIGAYRRRGRARNQIAQASKVALNAPRSCPGCCHGVKPQGTKEQG